LFPVAYGQIASLQRASVQTNTLALIYTLLDRIVGRPLDFATGLYVESSPAVADGVVYVGSSDGNVYALGLPWGALAPEDGVAAEH
jgi:hypothetical protein